MRALRRIAVAVTVVGSIAAPVLGQDGDDTAERKLELSGFVDGFYSYNANQPADRENFFPGVGTSGKRDSEFALNLAQVDLVMDAAPVGFHIALGFGHATEVVHAAELDPDTWEHVVRASMQYQTKVGRGLLLEGGIYPCHVGFEAFQTKDNWNYTRSWLGELSPYYQAGVKAAYPFSERWSGQLHLINGWQMIEDVNRGESVGWQVAYGGEKLTWSLNGIVGPELADPRDHDLRTFVDTVVVYEATPSFTLGGSIDAARQENALGANAEWWGAGLYGRYAPPDSRSAVAVRTEYYDDDDGAISGTAQTLKEVTLTFEHRPVESLILKLEGRYDRSDAPVFAGDDVDGSGAAIRDEDDQLLALIGAVVRF
jgi:hypothetical protein